MAERNVEMPSLAAHVQTYDKVIGLFKWGALAVGLIAALVIWLIAG